jgi:hypothetical protein
VTATNHVTTGVLIALVTSNPWVALPVALLSHIVFDSVPHYGVDPEKQFKIFLPSLLIDMTVAASILVTLLLTQPAHYWLLIATGITAASPDLLSIAFFVDILRNKKHQFGLVQRFLGRIQWSETVLPGLPIEVMYFGISGALVLQRLH